MTTQLLTQDDTLHRSLVQQMAEKFPQEKFLPAYLLAPETTEMTNKHLVLEQLRDQLTILNLEVLPFPLPESIKVVAILSFDKNQTYAALLANDRVFANYERFCHSSIQHTFGKVYLVGAGQCSKELLTIKAHELLQKADIIFYDSLIDNSILELSQAVKVFVGKRAANHFKDQKDINRLLFEAALKHSTVIRLKGGDPMVFGHAGEEIAFLEGRQIQVETVPGISSVLGASALANLPLTLRNISNSVSFCSGHERSKIEVPNTDTIVYFMGAGNLRAIANALLEHQRPQETPLTLFYNIGGPDQEVFYETIQSILHSEKVYKAPLLVIAGEVGNRHCWYQAFQYKPKILFTGTNLGKYAHLGYVFHQPMIELRPLKDYTETDLVIESIGSFAWLIFTSLYAVDYFLKRWFDLGKDSRKLAQVKIASIGAVTTGRLREYGLLPDLQAANESSEGLVSLFSELGIKGTKILIPRSNLATNFLPDTLEEMGNQVVRLTVYENTFPANNQKTEVENFDQVIFTSPSCVDNFIKVYGSLPQKPEIICRGKETQKRVEHYR